MKRVVRVRRKRCPLSNEKSAAIKVAQGADISEVFRREHIVITETGVRCCALGEIKTSSVLRINEKGEWTEVTEIAIGSQPAWKYMEVTV